MSLKNKTLVFVLLFLGAGISFLFLPVKEYFELVQSFVIQLGWAGPMVVALAYALMTLAMIPGSVVTLAVGSLFGLGLGTLVVVVGSNLGALGAFFLSRTFLRKKVLGWAEQHQGFSSLDKAIGREGFKIVFLTRLSPAFPFTFLNYLLGLTGIKTSRLITANFLGMLPGTFLFVYLGSMAGATLTTELSASGSHLQLILQILGLCATVGVTLMITRMAKQSLSKSVPSSGETAAS